MNKRAVHFGAGNIGRGFLGQLYYESGYTTTFIDVVTEVVGALNERGGYPIHVVSNAGTETIAVEKVSAVHGGDIEAAAGAVSAADIVSTAVGVNVLPKVAPALARAVALRFQNPDAAPLNIIICENLIGAGPFLRAEVRKHLDAPLHPVLDAKVGFVEASIGRMVPVMTAAQRAADPLLVCVEPYCELPVDAAGFKGEPPAVVHMKPMANFGAYVERKLFVHNMSHAATAYLGYLRGHDYIWQAVEDLPVRDAVRAALEETCMGLHKKHGLETAALRAHANDLLARYANRALGDQVARVAKDPIRKLGPNDRLIGAARLCFSQEVPPAAVAFAAAAAMRYDHPDDPAAEELQALRKGGAVDAVLEAVCQIAPDNPLADFFVRANARLVSEGWTTRE
ncbi:MAG: mannitol dehydrogenase [Candidatus Hydrogenedentota bacterium]